MNINFNPNVPTRTLVLCGAGALAVVLVLAGLIWPAASRVGQLDRDIADMRARLDEQKILRPLFDSLKTLVKDVDVAGLPPVQAQKLPQEQVATVSGLFEESARRSGARIFSVTPDPDSLARGSKHLSVRAVVQGEVDAFRLFLLEVGRLPYLDQVGGVVIRQTPDGREYAVTVWLALE